MEQALLKNTGFSFGGFILKMQFTNGRSRFFCDSIWNAFEEKSEVDSDFSFYIHADAPGDELLKNTEYASWTGEQIVLNYSDKDSYFILTADPASKEMHLFDTTTDGNSRWFEKLGIMFSWLSLDLNACNLHAVILEVQGKGILLTAPSGTGKSTHAHYWRDVENALIINGDRALLRKMDEKWYACGSPWSGTSGECVNRRVPLSAIVVLKQGPENRVRKLGGMEAFQKILPRVIAPRFVPGLSEKGIDYAGELAGAVPVFELACTDSPESVGCLKEALVSEGVL